MRLVFQKCYSRQGEMTEKSSNEFMALRATLACSRGASSAPCVHRSPACIAGFAPVIWTAACGIAQVSALPAARVLTVAAAEFWNDGRESALRSKFTLLARSQSLRWEIQRRSSRPLCDRNASQELPTPRLDVIARWSLRFATSAVPELAFAPIPRNSLRSRRVCSSDDAVLL